MLRATAFYTGQIIATLLFGSLCPLLRLCPYHYRHRTIQQWSRFSLWWLRRTCQLSYTITGQLPKAPGIIACNHQSAWETIALQAILGPHAFVLKRELLWIPLFGWGLRALEHIAINRRQPAPALRSILTQGKQRLLQNRWVVIFPEGTRSSSHYHPTAALLAIQTQLPIIPIAHNAGQYWPARSFTKKPGTIHLKIGNPIPSTHKTPHQLTTETRHWIEQTCTELNA